MELNEQQEKALKDQETLELLEMELYRRAELPENKVLLPILEDFEAHKPILEQCLNDALKYGFYPNISDKPYHYMQEALATYCIIAFQEGKTLAQLVDVDKRIKQSESPLMALMDEMALFQWKQNMRNATEAT